MKLKLIWAWEWNLRASGESVPWLYPAIFTTMVSIFAATRGKGSSSVDRVHAQNAGRAACGFRQVTVCVAQSLSMGAKASFEATKITLLPCKRIVRKSGPGFSPERCALSKKGASN
ncbi:hypothetical protein [Microvirga sp. TS319]|uniref:hypothetical protein n=1 Tax=Microvirga sp. TS319 TaxID=3241165 RepID=UPI00351A2907